VTVKVSILDLTVDQVEQLELELALPVDRWTDYPSRAGLYRRVYAMATGDDPATVGAMTMRQLTEAVSIGEDTETANPP